MNGIFILWRSFWYSNIPFKMKKLVFKCAAFSTLLSACSAFVMPRQTLQTMSNRVCNEKKTISVVQGETYLQPCVDNHLKHPVSLSNVEVLALFDITPFTPEFATIRFKWFMQIVREPERHRPYIAALFGKLYVGDADDSQLVHPHSHQLNNDILKLRICSTNSQVT